MYGGFPTDANFNDLRMFHMQNWLSRHNKFFRKKIMANNTIPLIFRIRKFPVFWQNVQIPSMFFFQQGFLLLPFSLFALCSRDPVNHCSRNSLRLRGGKCTSVLVRFFLANNCTPYSTISLQTFLCQYKSPKDHSQIVDSYATLC